MIETLRVENKLPLLVPLVFVLGMAALIPWTLIEPNLLLIAVILSAVVCGFILYKPFYGLLLLVLLIPSQSTLAITANVTIFKLFFFFYFLTVVGRKLIAREPLSVDRVFLFLLSGFLLVSLASLHRTTSFTYSMIKTTIYFYRVALVLIIPWVIRDQRELHRLGWAFVVTAFLSASMAVYELFTSGTAGFHRVSGLFAYSNLLSEFLLFCLPLVFFYLTHEQNRIRRVFLWLTVAVIGVSVMSAQSRSSWALLGLVLIYSLVFIYRRKKRFLPVAVLLGAFLVLGYTYNPQRQYINIRYKELLERTLDIGFRQSRIALGFRLFQENPVLGVGVGEYVAFSMRSGLLFVGVPHNIVVLVLAETGLLGLLFYGSIHAYTISRYIQATRPASRRASQDVNLLAASFLGGYLSWLIAAQFHGYTPFGIFENFAIGISLAFRTIHTESTQTGH